MSQREPFKRYTASPHKEKKNGNNNKADYEQIRTAMLSAKGHAELPIKESLPLPSHIKEFIIFMTD